MYVCVLDQNQFLLSVDNPIVVRPSTITKIKYLL